jgi:hypothetical protein
MTTTPTAEAMPAMAGVERPSSVTVFTESSASAVFCEDKSVVLEVEAVLDTESVLDVKVELDTEVVSGSADDDSDVDVEVGLALEKTVPTTTNLVASTSHVAQISGSAGKTLKRPTPLSQQPALWSQQ